MGDAMQGQLRRSWLWLKLYSRLPELLLQHHEGIKAGFVEARAFGLRALMESFLLSLPISPVVWLMFGNDIAYWTYFISTGVFFT